jgi:hypothetical protein
MTREQAIEKLRQENWRPTPGLDFEIHRLEPQDAWGVARCFYAIYGAEYPFDTYYLPEKLMDENARGNIYTVVARASNDDIVGHGALYRSSCPNPRVFEVGQLMVMPEYRTTFVVGEIIRHLQGEAVQALRPVELFGEAVCHHVMTQKTGSRYGYVDCAIEVGLMPAASYTRKEYAADRVSTLLHFFTYEDWPQTLYMPARYREELEFLIAGLPVERTVRECEPCEPAGTTGLDAEVFGFAQVARAQVRAAGADFGRVAERFDAESKQAGARVLQLFLNLGEPGVAGAVEWLRSRGYFFGGLLPRWFETDGLLMQKVLDLPDFRSIKLHTDRARRLLELIRRDLNALDWKE